MPGTGAFKTGALQHNFLRPAKGRFKKFDSVASIIIYRPTKYVFYQVVLCGNCLWSVWFVRATRAPDQIADHKLGATIFSEALGKKCRDGEEFIFPQTAAYRREAPICS
jgi:hypothetical protein